MRVLHVIPSIGSARGGPSVVLRTMAEWQAAQGIGVEVATTDDNGAERTETRAHGHSERGVIYHVFPRQLRFYTISFPLARWLKENSSRFDVIHLHALFSYAPVIAARIASHAGTPFIVRPLGTLNRWGMSERRPWLKKTSFRCVERRILRLAAAVHFTSDQERIEASELNAVHSPVVIPNPVELPARLTARSEFRSRHGLGDRPLVLFLSRVDPKKGLDLLIPAFAEVRAKRPDAALVIAGDGDASLLANLKRRAEEIGLGSSILWTGFLEGAAKQAALTDADLFVLPSYSENFGVAAVEALGAGLPVIVSNQVGIHREVSAAGAGLVVNCSTTSLASAMLQALGDPGWRAAAAASASQLAKSFAPDVVGARILELYESVRTRNDRSAAA